MAIFLRQSYNIQPVRWGSFTDIQYAIQKNSEKIYSVDPGSNVLTMPMFWGFPCLDFSGKQNHGTPVGGVAYHSGSLDFDGVDDYVDCGEVDGAEDIPAISVSTWFKPKTTGVGNNNKQIVAKWGISNDWVLGYKNDDTNTLWFVVDTGGSVFSYGSVAIDDINKWYYLTATYNGSNLIVYTNGVAGTPVADSGNIAVGTDNVVIGAYSIGSDGVNGLIAEARINNIALTAEQVALFYARPWDLYRRVGRTYYSIAGEVLTTTAPTTVSPTTLAPTTLTPTSLAPTTLAPTTLPPTSLAPTTLPATTLAPTTLAPTSLAPTTIAPTTVAPTSLAPTTLAPTTLPATTLAPTTLAPTTLEPTTLAPTTLVPTTAAVTTLAPTTVAPTTAVATTVAPTTIASTTSAPTSLAPTSLAPTTIAPSTLLPTTLAPTTSIPTTIGPTTLPSTTLAPTTLVPTTDVPEAICTKICDSPITTEILCKTNIIAEILCQSPITKEILCHGNLC